MAGDDRTVLVDDAQLERIWALTCALAANEDHHRRSLDQVFLVAARFVARVDEGLGAPEGVELDSGKTGPNGAKITYRVKRRR